MTNPNIKVDCEYREYNCNGNYKCAYLGKCVYQSQQVEGIKPKMTEDCVLKDNVSGDSSSKSSFYKDKTHSADKICLESSGVGDSFETTNIKTTNEVAPASPCKKGTTAENFNSAHPDNYNRCTLKISELERELNDELFHEGSGAMG